MRPRQLRDPLCESRCRGELQSIPRTAAELDWTLLLKVAQQILTKLEKTLDGAAQNVKLPLVGNALDAGANVVGAFNTNVITPFNQLVERPHERCRPGRRRRRRRSIRPREADARLHLHEPRAGRRRTCCSTRTASTATDRDAGRRRRDGALRHGLAPCADGDGAHGDQGLPRHVQARSGDHGDVPFDIGLEGRAPEAQGRHPRQRLVEPARRHRHQLLGRPVHRGQRQEGLRRRRGPENRDFDDRTRRDDRTIRRLLRADEVPPGRRHRLQRVEQLRPATTSSRSACGSRTPRTRRRAAGSRKVEEHMLRCDDFGTTDVEGVDWSGEDDYKLVARHAPDVPASRAASPSCSSTGIVSMGDAAVAVRRRDGAPAITWPATATTRTTTAASRARSRSSRSTSTTATSTRPERRVRHDVHGRRGRADGAVPVRVARLQVGRRARSRSPTSSRATSASRRSSPGRRTSTCACAPG